MRKWRVGTFSMGISLISIGITFLVSAWKGMSAFDTLIGWSPIIFILLGCEVLLYLRMSRKEHPVIHYDIISMLVVGAIGVMSIGFAFMISTGLLTEIRYQVRAVEMTVDLPSIRQNIPAEVQRIVVQAPNRNVKIDRTSGREFGFFGHYQAIMDSEQALAKLTADEATTIQTIGNTMYIAIKELPRSRGIRSHYPYASINLVLPEDVQIELRGADNQPYEI